MKTSLLSAGILAALILASTPLALADDVAGCKPEDYVQGTADNNSIKTSGHHYVPKCLKIPAGATVTIDAGFIHPVQGMADVDGVHNPFVRAAGPSMKALTERLTEAGTFGYYCDRHGDSTGKGMAGAIRVEPAIR